MPQDFRRQKKSTLEGMIREKMSLYFWDKSAVTSYEPIMRLAGPYWFSFAERQPCLSTCNTVWLRRLPRGS